MIKCRKLRWVWHLARFEEGRSAFNILTAKPTGPRLLGRPRRRCEDNIIVDLAKIGVSTWYWIDSFQDLDYWRLLVNDALNLRVS